MDESFKIRTVEWIPTTEEIMEDAPNLRSYIDEKMFDFLHERGEIMFEKIYIDQQEEPVEQPFNQRLENLQEAYDNGHPDSRKFYRKLLDMAELHDRKQADYGRDTDPLANVRRASTLGIKPSLGVLLRMGDKFGRFESFALKGELQNESVEDSAMDVAVYAIMLLVLLENGE